MSTQSASDCSPTAPAKAASPVGEPPDFVPSRAEPRPWLVRACKLSQRSFGRLQVGLEALHNGFWLGVLDKPLLDAACEQYYDERPAYQNSDYNRKGLSDWEREMVDRFFPPAGRLLVTAAGGGREVLALHKRGYQLDAVECNPRLVASANRFLESEQVPCVVGLVAPDSAPAGAQRYDAIVVGWGSYMLIQGRARRIAFLRALRGRLQDGAPLLLSFFTRDEDTPYFRLMRAVANGLRTVLRREPIDLGDSLTPSYAHYFRQEELAAELQAAGFELLYFGDTDYGHAVGRAI